MNKINQLSLFDTDYDCSCNNCFFSKNKYKDNHRIVFNGCNESKERICEHYLDNRKFERKAQ